MKKLSSFLKSISVFNAVAIAISFVSGFALEYFGVLYIKVTIPIWLLLLLTVSPNIVYLLIRLWWLCGKRQYKPKTLVSIIADQRKFMLVRYHKLRPLYAICKEVDNSSVISLHQKYIEPWHNKKPTTNNAINTMLGKRNINTAVPTATIRTL